MARVPGPTPKFLDHIDYQTTFFDRVLDGHHQVSREGIVACAFAAEISIDGYTPDDPNEWVCGCLCKHNGEYIVVVWADIGRTGGWEWVEAKPECGITHIEARSPIVVEDDKYNGPTSVDERKRVYGKKIDEIIKGRCQSARY